MGRGGGGLLSHAGELLPGKRGLFSTLRLLALLLTISKHDLSHRPWERTKDNDLESVTRQTKVTVLTMIFFAWTMIGCRNTNDFSPACIPSWNRVPCLNLLNKGQILP